MLKENENFIVNQNLINSFSYANGFLEGNENYNSKFFKFEKQNCSINNEKENSFNIIKSNQIRSQNENKTHEKKKIFSNSNSSNNELLKNLTMEKEFLESNLGIYKNTMFELEKKLKNIHSEKSSLLNEIEIKNAKIQYLEKNNLNLKEEKNNLMNILSQKNDQIKNLSFKNDSLSKNIRSTNDKSTFNQSENFYLNNESKISQDYLKEEKLNNLKIKNFKIIDIYKEIIEKNKKIKSELELHFENNPEKNLDYFSIKQDLEHF